MWDEPDFNAGRSSYDTATQHYSAVTTDRDDSMFEEFIKREARAVVAHNNGRYSSSW